MALGRRGNGQPPVNIWPGFVDAMTALLLVLFFVLSIFMIVQFVLSETITGQDRELSELSEQVAGLADALGLEQNTSRDLSVKLGELDGALSAAANRENQQNALISTLTAQRNQLQQAQTETAAQIASFEEQIASILANSRDHETALLQARDAIDLQEEQARLAAARARALEAMVTDLEAETGRRAAQMTDMQDQIANATQALFLAQVARREAQQQIISLSGENRDLNSNLAAAQNNLSDDQDTLAGLVADLATVSAEKAVLQGQYSLAEQGRIAALAQLEGLQGDAASAALLIARNEADLAERNQSLEQARENAERLATLLEDRKIAIVAAELALAERASQLDETERARVSEAASAQAARAELSAIQEATRALQEDLNIAQMARIAVLQELSSARENSVGTNTALAISETRLEASEREMAEAEAELQAAETALVAQRETLAAADAAATEMAAQISNFNVQITASQLALAERAVTAESAAAEIAAYGARIAESQTALDAAKINEARLAELLSDRDIAITAAELALAERAAALSDAEKAQLADAAAAEALRTRLESADTELTAMALALEEERQKALETLTQLAAARAAQQELATSEGTSLTMLEQQQVALAEAQRLLRLEEAASADSQRQIALLNQQTAALRGELNQLQGILDASASKDIAAQIRIETLGADLNTALARTAAEQRRTALAQSQRADAEAARADAEARERALLETEANDLRNFRSEFFGRMREVLGDREGVQIVGDRFVFSSEVLFAVGSADLGADGKAQIGQVAAVLREVSDEIPEGINWILRVDGHTDKTRLGTGGRFADNWELSQARALSVVKYLVDFEDIPANRLAATGFGEFQPVNNGDSPADLSENRRIELKFTER